MKHSAQPPPIVPNSGSIEQELRQLRKEFISTGLLDPDIRAYVLRTCWIVPIYLSSWIGLLYIDSPLGVFFIYTIVAICSVQSAAIAHEAAHGAISKNRKLISLLGQFFMSFLMGSSYSSWVDKHNLHHAKSNSRNDPDLQAGLFCFNEQDARKSKGIQRLCTKNQHLLIWPLATLMGYSFKVKSIQYLISNPNKTGTDQWVMLMHYLFWLVLPSIFIGVTTTLTNYLIITWIEGIYLAFIFLTNHMGRPSAESLSHCSPASRQIVCARNIKYSWLLNVICNGLISHIEHHLFCNISYTKLHLARPYIRSLCLKFDIPYHEVSLITAFVEFAQHNKKMANIARGHAYPNAFT